MLSKKQLLEQRVNLIYELRKSNERVITFSVLKAFASIGFKIVIVGKGASGKDHLANEMIQMSDNLKKIIWNTTRPKRNHEVNHVDYHFHTTCDDVNSIYKSSFNIAGEEWIYWLIKNEWDCNDITIATPDFVNNLSLINKRNDTIVLYIDECVETRRTRLVKRSDEDSVERRITTDELDFHGFDDFDYIISHGFFLTKDEYQSRKV